ncbi:MULTISPECIES: DUF397 domain-containing protein [Micromonospora]|uniref:DUF397 domain-containing protein n=1 Tax=Micromonospora TaxID=1873 RepID=UPI000A4B7862|nr:DUF397 domain-containing protein [Micromonospora yangpuensis]GGM29956.1 hypothetical protein GCM10012279_55980 [Micromonospora yangpuensis]
MEVADDLAGVGGAGLAGGGVVGVRDSKDRAGAVLAFAPTRWRAFVDALKSGHLT